MPPKPTGLLYSDRHPYFPRFNAPPLRWGLLYDKLFQLQVPSRPYKNTLYTGALWSYGGQNYVWQYSDWLVNNSAWTC